MRKEHDSMMVSTYFEHVKLIRKLMAKAGWPTPKEKDVNLSLLQRPKKIKAKTTARFIYAPCELTVSKILKPGTIINILDVFEGDTPAETTLKVMESSEWNNHRTGYTGRRRCSAHRKDYDKEANPCECHMDPSEISDDLRARIHYILLTDVGK